MTLSLVTYLQLAKTDSQTDKLQTCTSQVLPDLQLVVIKNSGDPRSNSPWDNVGKNYFEDACGPCQIRTGMKMNHVMYHIELELF